jgi:hypothetical protein
VSFPTEPRARALAWVVGFGLFAAIALASVWFLYGCASAMTFGR